MTKLAKHLLLLISVMIAGGFGAWIGGLIRHEDHLRYPYQLARFLCYEQKERELVLTDSVAIGVRDKRILWSFVYDSKDTLMCDSAWKAGK